MSSSRCLTARAATPPPALSSSPTWSRLQENPPNKAHFLVSLDATSTLRVLVDTQGQGDLFFGTDFHLGS